MGLSSRRCPIGDRNTSTADTAVNIVREVAASAVPKAIATSPYPTRVKIDQDAVNIRRRVLQRDERREMFWVIDERVETLWMGWFLWW